MSEKVLKEIIQRAVEDEAFRGLLFSHPKEALKGYKLTAVEIETLSNLNEDNFDEFAGGLGDRTTKGIWTPGT